MFRHNITRDYNFCTPGDGNFVCVKKKIIIQQDNHLKNEA